MLLGHGDGKMEYRKIIQTEGERPTAYNAKLPLPLVHYPNGGLGGFLAFQKEKGSQFFFCSCAKIAIENYIDLRLSTDFDERLDLDNTPLLKPGYFPLAIVENTPNNFVAAGKSIIEKLNFKNNICHECQDILPKYRYCHEMYGTKFKQNYGWYINKQYFEYGMYPGSSKVISNNCPNEVLELLNAHEIQEKEKRVEKLRNKKSQILDEAVGNDGVVEDFDWEFPDEYFEIGNKISQLENEISKGYRRLENAVENEVREKLDHYKVGEKWTSETILYHLVDTKFPELDVQKHARPEFLDGLELDIYIEERDFGIEYQGIQHYEPVEHWGGEQGLKERKQRDKRKKKLCRKNGVNLIYFTYNEDLSEELVEQKLCPYSATG